jgi:CheY-like chemotaxis protein
MSRSKPRVLLADDTLFFRTALSEILEAEGWEVLQAADGRAALERARQELSSLDLLILDVEMPEMDGLDVLEQVRQAETSDPVTAVVLSGNRFTAEQQERLRTLDAREVLQKSVPLPQLAQQIVLLLEGD